MEEIWRPVAGYEGLYEVSNYGNVRGIDRNVSRGCKGVVLFKGKTLEKRKSKDGHLRVVLYNLNHEAKTCFVHCLVANAFIPNPDHLPFVNHKDERPENNFVNNLEWCTHLYNCNYGSRNSRISSALSKPIKMLSINGEVIKVFKSATEAGKYLGKYPVTNICNVANHKNGFCTAYGYKWEWA